MITPRPGPLSPRDRDRRWTQALMAALGGLSCLTAMLTLPILSTPGVCAREPCSSTAVLGLIGGVIGVCLLTLSLASARLARASPGLPVASVGLGVALAAFLLLLITVG